MVWCHLPTWQGEATCGASAWGWWAMRALLCAWKEEKRGKEEQDHGQTCWTGNAHRKHYQMINVWVWKQHLGEDWVSSWENHASRGPKEPGAQPLLRGAWWLLVSWLVGWYVGDQHTMEEGRTSDPPGSGSKYTIYNCPRTTPRFCLHCTRAELRHQYF